MKKTELEKRHISCPQENVMDSDGIRTKKNVSIPIPFSRGHNFSSCQSIEILQVRSLECIGSYKLVGMGITITYGM